LPARQSFSFAILGASDTDSFNLFSPLPEEVKMEPTTGPNIVALTSSLMERRHGYKLLFISVQLSLGMPPSVNCLA
jgi:hypothetical protein